MKATHLIAASIFFLSGQAIAVTPSSSLTLEHGAAYAGAISPLYRTQSDYDFQVDQFWHSNSSTALSIKITEILEQSSFSIPPGAICACVVSYSPPAVSMFSFTLPLTVDTPYGGNNGVIGLNFSIDNASYAFDPFNTRITVQIGEMETQTLNGVETLTRFAADFVMQYGQTVFAESGDPLTGSFGFTQTFVEQQGNWLAGSLRYQSGTQAFAFLTPVPEPNIPTQLLAGLALVGLFVRYRS